LRHAAIEFAPSSLEKYPALHGVHTLALLAAVADDHDPAGHASHTAMPPMPTMRYVPVRHDVQFLMSIEPSSSVDLPGPQAKHVLLLWAPFAAEYVPSAHGVHMLAPLAAEYVPARHNKHALAVATPSLADAVPSGHWVQSDAAAILVAIEYVPPGQYEHAVDPAAAYRPAPHVRQSLASVAPSFCEYVPPEHATHCDSAVAPVVVR
jgi:hypothetical protein